MAGIFYEEKLKKLEKLEKLKPNAILQKKLLKRLQKGYWL